MASGTIKKPGLRVLGVQSVAVTVSSVSGGGTGSATGTGTAVDGAAQYWCFYQNSGGTPCVPAGQASASVSGATLTVTVNLKNLSSSSGNLSARFLVMATD